MADYRQAGVDLAGHDALIARIAERAAEAVRPGLLRGVGLFAGAFQLGTGPEDPVLCATTDSVGTKVLLAAQLGGHEVIGQDVVIHCANDVVTLGAEPIFFLDYLAVHTLDQAWVDAILAGIAGACRQAGCALLGGETAQMPDLYSPGSYDLAGTMVGWVRRSKLVEPCGAPGDVVVALPSSGLHTNGFSLVRRIVHDAGVDPALYRDWLLVPSALYSPDVLQLLGDGVSVHGMAHITGGGIGGNLNRALPPVCDARIDPTAWERPAVFDWLQRLGAVPEEEMRRVFNLGVGFCLIVPPTAVDAVMARRPDARVIGALVPGSGKVVFAC